MSPAKRVLRVVPRYCHRVFLFLAGLLICFALFYLPFLFGFQPISIHTSESGSYPAGAFSYCSLSEGYMNVGDPVVLFSQDGTEIKVIAEIDASANIFRTLSGEEIRTEFIIGTPAKFCLPLLGPFLLSLFSFPSFLAVFAAGLLSAAGTFLLPRLLDKKETPPETDAPAVSLTAEGLRAIRFERLPGDLYRAAEVDAALRGLIQAAEEREEQALAEDTERDKAIISIRAKMTEKIVQAVLEAERELGPFSEDE